MTTCCPTIGFTATSPDEGDDDAQLTTVFALGDVPALFGGEPVLLSPEFAAELRRLRAEKK